MNDLTITPQQEKLLEIFRLLLIPLCCLVIGAIFLVIARAVKNRKPADLIPYLFIWTVVFLFIANISLLVRVAMRIAGHPLVSLRTSPLMVALTFVTSFGIAAAYWIFAQRYWELSMKLHELKFGEKLGLSLIEKPINIILWLLIFAYSATVTVKTPNWLALASFGALIIIDVVVWLVMVDAMRRIWKVGSDLSGTFPN